MYLQTNLYLQTGRTGFGGSAGDRVDTNLIIYFTCFAMEQLNLFIILSNR